MGRLLSQEACPIHGVLSHDPIRKRLSLCGYRPRASVRPSPRACTLSLVRVHFVTPLPAHLHSVWPLLPQTRSLGSSGALPCSPVSSRFWPRVGGQEMLASSSSCSQVLICFDQIDGSLETGPACFPTKTQPGKISCNKDRELRKHLMRVES